VREKATRGAPGYLQEAAGSVYEVDRHAKKELKKHVRGVREIECQVEDRSDPAAEVVRGYRSAVCGTDRRRAAPARAPIRK
jgi:hypothetical protein